MVAQAVEQWRRVPIIRVRFRWVPGFFLFLSQWRFLFQVPRGDATLTDSPNKKIGLALQLEVNQAFL